LLNTLDALIKQGINVVLVTAFPHYPKGVIPKEYRHKIISIEKWRTIKVIRVPVIPLPHRTSIERFLNYISFSCFALLTIPFLGPIDITWAFSQKLFSFIPGFAQKIVKKSFLVIDMADIWPEALVNTGNIRSNGFLFKIISCVMRIIYSLSDRVITLNEAMKKLIVDSTNVSPSKISIMTNIVDVKLFRPIDIPRKKEFRDKFIIMYSGNFGPNYDFQTLLKAALELKSKAIDVLFIIRGYGEMEAFISRFIKEEGLMNVLLDNQLLERDDLILYLNKADTFVLPMKKCPYPDASFSIKLLDYLSCGKPIICCAEGYLSTFVSEHRAGISIEPGDHEALSKVVLNLKQDQKTRNEISRNARRLAEDNFSYKTLENEIVQLVVPRVNSDA